MKEKLFFILNRLSSQKTQRKWHNVKVPQKAFKFADLVAKMVVRHKAGKTQKK